MPDGRKRPWAAPSMGALDHELSVLAEARGFRVAGLAAEWVLEHGEWWFTVWVPGTDVYGLMRLRGSLSPGEAVEEARSMKAGWLDEIERAPARKPS